MTPFAVAPMKPPSTATLPAAESAARSRSRARSQVSIMSGAAAVCSASVTSTVRASTHALGDAAVGERGGDDPAADQLADRLHRVERARRHLAQHRQRVHEAGQLVEFASHIARAASRGWRSSPRPRPSRWRSSSACSSRGGAGRVAVLGQLRDRDQRVGHPRQRRHDDDRRAIVRRSVACCRRTMPIRRLIASGSATDVPPNFITTLIGSLPQSWVRSGAERVAGRPCLATWPA